MITKEQIVRVHTLKAKLGMRDEEYRALLSGYEVESCKEMTVLQADTMCRFLQDMLDKRDGKTVVRTGRGSRRYAELEGRGSDWATPAQLRMLEAMWMDVTVQRSRDDALVAYRSFLMKRWSVAGPEMIRRDQVGPIRMALQAMVRQKKKKGS
jgi:hypothetical protein